MATNRFGGEMGAAEKVEQVVSQRQMKTNRENERAALNQEPGFDVSKGMWVRACPGYDGHECGVELAYPRRDQFKAATQENKRCRSCGSRNGWAGKKEVPPEGGYWKLCPGVLNEPCGQKQTYKSKYALAAAIENGSVCLSCANRRRPPVSDATRKLQSKVHSGVKMSAESSAKKSVANSGANNPMAGRTVYEVWVEKYGTDEANRLKTEQSKKISKRVSGSGNPMYGKPSPQGAGNGWSGWFNEHYFRSLGELNYLLLLEANNEVWAAGEAIQIPYINWEGAVRTYSPDFITYTEVIECKPIRLHTTPGVLEKAAAGKIWAEGQGLTYRLVDPGKPSFQTIAKLLADGQMKFNKTYEKKFQEYVAKHPELAIVS